VPVTNRRYQKNPSVEVAPLNSDQLLFHPGSNKFVVLNRTSGVVWEKLASPRTAEELSEELCRSFDGVAGQEALRDVEGVLSQLESLGFVVAQDATPA
jgi:hypothetical protein